MQVGIARNTRQQNSRLASGWQEDTHMPDTLGRDLHDGELTIEATSGPFDIPKTFVQIESNGKTYSVEAGYIIENLLTPHMSIGTTIQGKGRVWVTLEEPVVIDHRWFVKARLLPGLDDLPDDKMLPLFPRATWIAEDSE